MEAKAKKKIKEKEGDVEMSADNFTKEQETSVDQESTLFLGFLNRDGSVLYFNPIAEVVKNCDGYSNIKQLEIENVKDILKSDPYKHLNFKLNMNEKECIEDYVNSNINMLFVVSVNKDFISVNPERSNHYYGKNISKDDIKVIFEQEELGICECIPSNIGLAIEKDKWKYIIFKSDCNNSDDLEKKYKMLYDPKEESDKVWFISTENTSDLNTGNTIGLNTILYGPPGTGKTFHAVNYAVDIIGINNKENPEYAGKSGYELIKTAYDDFVNAGRIAFVTFHQSYGYEEFIEGIKPVLKGVKDSQSQKVNRGNEDTCNLEEANNIESQNNNAGTLEFRIEPGIFKAFCDEARKDNNKGKKFVFIIDEINRGNISKIFGELITLIEPNKRAGNDEEMKVKLPYSKEEFSVPNNVYILGTMNTAGRSIALIDTALRRRFNFIEMMPRSDLLEDMKLTINKDGEFIDIQAMLETINNRIEILYDREHTIGQAFFMKLKKNPSLEVLADIFKTNIIPLLQEYFYEDYEKIQWILGDNNKKDKNIKFIQNEKIDLKEAFFGGIECDKENKYSINKDAFSEPYSYIYIYKQEKK
jgi:5-methylcytosine-specific restriction endonuclease McrBC GTP-binding regulatory subunit McrB